MGKSETADRIPQCASESREKKDLNTEGAEEEHRGHGEEKRKKAA
jgi:hypothetical protein